MYDKKLTYRIAKVYPAVLDSFHICSEELSLLLQPLAVPLVIAGWENSVHTEPDNWRPITVEILRNLETTLCHSKYLDYDKFMLWGAFSKVFFRFMQINANTAPSESRSDVATLRFHDRNLKSDDVPFLRSEQKSAQRHIVEVFIGTTGRSSCAVNAVRNYSARRFSLAKAYTSESLAYVFLEGDSLTRHAVKAVLMTFLDDATQLMAKDWSRHICVECGNFARQNSSTWPMVKLGLRGIYTNRLFDGISLVIAAQWRPYVL